MDCNFGVVSKKLSSNSKSSRFSPTLSSKNFIVLHFTLRLVIHFELMVVKSVRSVSGFTYFLHVDLCCSSAISWKDYLICMAFVPFSNNGPLHLCVCCLFSCVWLFVTLWTLVHQAPLSMGFYRQKYWSGSPQGIFPTQGLNSRLSCLLHW